MIEYYIFRIVSKLRTGTYNANVLHQTEITLAVEIEPPRKI
jgi:hypothetical protein